MPFTDWTCGKCGFEWTSNCAIGDIKCPECEAIRCPHCLQWFDGHEDAEAEPVSVAAADMNEPAVTDDMIDRAFQVIAEEAGFPFTAQARDYVSMDSTGERRAAEMAALKAADDEATQGNRDYVRRILAAALASQPAPGLRGGVPQAAVDAAVKANDDWYDQDMDIKFKSGQDVIELAKVMLEAAAPHIIAAERDRIRQLAANHGAHYHSCGVPCEAEHSERPFADLIGDPQ